MRTYVKVCPTCGGRGWLGKEVCLTCNGDCVFVFEDRRKKNRLTEGVINGLALVAVAILIASIIYLAK